MRIEPRAQVPLALAIAAPLVTAAATLALATVMFALSGMPARHGYALMLAGAFGSPAALQATLTHAAPLMLSGLAATIAFRLKLWNLGTAGQVQAGAVAALAVGSGLGALPGIAMMPLVLAAGAFAGALLMLIPAWLKVRRGTDEATVTLLFNIMMMVLMPALLNGPLAGADGQPRTLTATALLPKPDWLFAMPAGVLIALVAVVVIRLALPFTVWGFQVRATAGNAVAARFAGINVDRVIVSIGLLSGALAGFAGAVAIVSETSRLTPSIGVGIGYAGIAVAVLAGRSLPAVVIAALFIATLQSGAAALPRGDMPMHAADVWVALVLILALVTTMLVRFRVRRAVPAQVTA